MYSDTPSPFAEFEKGQKPSKIYILVDPRTDEIRYVGKTNQRLEWRISAHMQSKEPCHRTHWLNELKALGLGRALAR